MYSLGSDYCQSKLQGGNVIWPLITPSLEVLITPEVTRCVPGCFLDPHSSLAFILLNFIIMSPFLYRFPLVWMCFPGCCLSVTLMYWLMPAGPSHICQMDPMIKFKQSLMQEYVGDLWSCWCKISLRKCVCSFVYHTSFLVADTQILMYYTDSLCFGLLSFVTFYIHIKSVCFFVLRVIKSLLCFLCEQPFSKNIWKTLIYLVLAHT